ncbi:hypothetical protein ONZ51_g6840 [Trametes cubensis]|uniref:F-box domain-containing protein n=1 Tax=Trametes cubensis TaxID=1111947 RepID=A0AAD7TTS4_9APHY|nr:hypothetical protein ONZ51_g6840 [Trametes cubensis]
MGDLTHSAALIQNAELSLSDDAEAATKQNEREALYLHNSCLPVNRLPPELLLELFLGYVRDPYKSSRVPWARLRGVCLHWSQFALSTPILWRRIDVYASSRWLALCLQNARETTMDVMFHARELPAADLCLLLPHTHRLRSLSFRTHISPEWMPTLLEILGGDLTALENLHYFPPPSEHHNLSHHLALTHSRTPLLHTLDLVGTRAPSDMALLSRLRKLSLSACSTDLTASDFLSALASNARLEVLELSHFLDNLSGGFNAPPSLREEGIALPRLRRLCLSDHSPHLTSVFLSLLRTPPTLNLNLSGDLGETEPDQIVSPIVWLLPPPSVRLSALPILASPTVTSITARLYQWFYEVHTDSLGSEKGSVSLEVLSANVNSWYTWLGQGIADVLDAFGSAQEVTSLTIYGDQASHSLTDWENVLRTFPKLEHISMVGTIGNSELWTVLQAGLDDDNDINGDNAERSSSVPYPRLKRIVYNGGVDATHAVCTDVLHCLRKRAERGCRLSSLELGFVHRSVSYEQMKAIYVPQFEAVVDWFAYLG